MKLRALCALAAPRLMADQSGSVAMLFGVTILVLCGMVAFSVDYSRTIAVRSRLQAAADAAVLAASPTGGQTQDQVNANVTNTFTYNMPDQYMSASVTVDPPVAITNGYRVTASADVPMSFGKLLGVDTITVRALAEAIRSQNNIEMALVLDNTFSMSGSKISALQSAAKSLVDQIVAASPAGTVKFALVPFSNYVNVGMQYRSAQWMSVPADWVETVPGGSYQTTDWAGCPTTTVTYSCPNDGVPQTCSYQQCTTPGPQRTVTYPSYPVNHVWNGCAGSRTPAPDLNVSASFNGPIPGILDVSCPSPLARLTTDDSSIKSQIDNMVATGETYISSGLMWGWRVLNPATPFADGVAYNSTPKTKKIMILMTDGFNTRSQSSTNHDGSDSTAADQALGQLCAAVKAPGVELYTIDFEVNNTASKALLQGCASGFDHYYDAKDAAALTDAFNNIASSVIKLALSK